MEPCTQASEICRIANACEETSNEIVNIRIDHARQIAQLSTQMINVLGVLTELKTSSLKQNGVGSRVSVLESRGWLVDKIVTILIAATVSFGFFLLGKFLT
jgi:hypothetical protein